MIVSTESKMARNANAGSILVVEYTKGMIAIPARKTIQESERDFILQKYYNMALFPCFLKIIENIFVTGGGSARFNYMEHYSRCWNWLIIPFFAAFLLMFIASSLWAQDSSKVKFLIGPVVGYNGVAYNTSEFTPPESNPDFDVVQNGNAGTQFFGISAQIPVISGMDKFLIIEGLYDSKSADFNSFGLVHGDSLINLSASLSYVLLNVGFKYNFFDTSLNTMPNGLGIQACASFGYAFNHQFNTVFDSVDSHLNTTGKSQNIVSNIEGINQIRIAIRTELTYDIPIGSRLEVTPSVGYDAPLTKVDNTQRNWWASSEYGAIALRYAFGS
jgi:hypothetical protein